MKNGPWDKWYQNINGQEQYIPKSNQLHAARLAYKRYLLAENEDIMQALRAVEAYLENYPTKRKTTELLEQRGYKELLQTFLQPEDENLRRWTYAQFEQNPYNPEKKIHHIFPGLSVRSKSEELIATQLHVNRIPFRYECALRLGRRTVYPDFTIRHPKTGETFYWEHLGLMDNPEYSQHACNKINRYADAGIHLYRQLLVTSETKQQPLTYSEVSKVIRDYFL